MSPGSDKLRTLEKANTNPAEPPEFATRDDLRVFLEAHGVDTIAWGVGGAKRVEDCLKELHEKDCTLALAGGKVFRSVAVVKLVIRNPEVLAHHLVCYEQQMADGRRRPRNVLLSEKMRIGETPQHAALRAIREELGSVKSIQQDDILLKESTHLAWEEVVESASYPNLPTRYELHQFEMRVRGLSKESFSTWESDGAGKAKIHYWRWTPDSDQDLRYKAPLQPAAPPMDVAAPPQKRPSSSPAEEETAAPSMAELGAGSMVAFINSPIGSATYWPSSSRVASSHRWQHGIDSSAAILMPAWERPRLRANAAARLSTQSAQRVTSSASPRPASRHLQPPEDSPSASPSAAPSAMPAPTQVAEVLPQPRHRRLYVRPGLDDPASDNGDTAPRSRRAHVRRMAANVNFFF